jgi:F0F1-type ATP synthase epsilon subunit
MKYLNVTVKDKKSVLYKGEAWAISSTNQKGNFDVLEEHANFISLIFGKVIIRKDEKDKGKIIEIDKGVMHVESDSVNVWVGI